MKEHPLAGFRSRYTRHSVPAEVLMLTPALMIRRVDHDEE
jgi:hypothetical protein